MVLGNGRIGKTQICRRLRGEAYDDTVPSTHGIVVRSAPLPGAPADDPARLKIWDFGGQDIYLGTHALFMRSRALFMLVWIPEFEERTEQLHGGFIFRNQPLAYWVEYVRQFGGASSPLVIVRTRCDRPQDAGLPAPISEPSLAVFPFRRTIDYSAKENRGRPALDDALAQAAEWLRQEQGIAQVGRGRAQVKRQLEAMRDADAALPSSERRHRTINYDEFLQMCQSAGDIAEPGYLLDYLHNAGTVFYRKGLFDDRIIIDQEWALDAIYVVFNREKCYRRLQRQQGRFRRSDLAEWVWDEAGYGIEEQKLFVSMMQSCGVCFEYHPGSRDRKIEAEYIAPDFLPDRAEIDLAPKWDASAPTESTDFEFVMLPPGLMRGIISHMGGEAGLAADYWKDGIFVYEATTGSRAIVEQKTGEGWRGHIRITTQHGQADELLRRLTRLVEQEQQRMGIAAKVSTSITTRTTRDDLARPGSESIRGRKQFTYAQPPSAKPEYFVSYAWGDDSPEGREREQIVDRLCEAAERKRKITILRDKTMLSLGDRISKFMDRLGKGDRIFIVLSDKYLKSEFCMYELWQVWRNCRQNDDEFLARIRLITVDDAKIWSSADRTRYAAHWLQQSRQIEQMISEQGAEVIGQKDFEKYRLMKTFSHQVGDILATVADIVQPRTFKEFEKYGFEDIPEAKR